MSLPPALRQALERVVEGASRSAIAARSDLISRHYRCGGASEVIADETDVAAYLLARLPATFAALSAVLSEVRRRAPGFEPKQLLDAGAGPGTASWTTVQAWPRIARIVMLDRNPNFLNMARRLCAASEHPALARATIEAGDLSEAGRKAAAADLIVASYVLSEWPEHAVAEIVSSLWARCTGVLILVEPGTPAGFRRILQCRDALPALGAKILAPCPHALACPMRAPDWCHFSQRLARSRDHMLAKSARLPFEDEKFSYLAVARPTVAVAPVSARVLAHPRKGKAAIALKLCQDGEVVMQSIARRDKENFARHRRTGWGDGL
jgi:ribosomal protein RSM22 (predicted rRNA methylase)